MGFGDWGENLDATERFILGKADLLDGGRDLSKNESDALKCHRNLRLIIDQQTKQIKARQVHDAENVEPYIRDLEHTIRTDDCIILHHAYI